MKAAAGIFFLAIVTGTAQAAWQVNSDHSHIYFMSYKNVDIAEAHRFKKVSGKVKDDGAVEISIHLESVDTQIPIRDERMRTYLFHTQTHPIAQITAKLDRQWLAKVEKGGAQQKKLAAKLTLNGKTQDIALDVLATRTTSEEVQVTSLKPVILNAESWGLNAGIEKLKSMAGLSSISLSVPVGFTLSFAKAE